MMSPSMCVCVCVAELRPVPLMAELVPIMAGNAPLKWKSVCAHIWLFLFSTFPSFYERKYAVFLRLFAHQREYQDLMNPR